MDRERILVGGPAGTGKTYEWLTIARLLPNRKFHVIDPDSGVIRVWKNDMDGFKDLTNIDYYFTPVWFEELKKTEDGWRGGIKEAFDQVKTRAKPDDWVVVEALDGIWDLAQGGFVDAVFDKGIGEYFLERRKSLTDKATRLDALDGWKDWTVIKKMHNDDFINKVCYQLPVHVYMTTGISVTTQSLASKEDAETRSFYGDSLFRLDGEKRNGRRVQSIFIFNKGKEGWKYMTFLKDRGRIWVENEELFDFGIQYLQGVAGWEV